MDDADTQMGLAKVAETDLALVMMGSARKFEPNSIAASAGPSNRIDAIQPQLVSLAASKNPATSDTSGASLSHLLYGLTGA
jgi:hypothetical protein